MWELEWVQLGTSVGDISGWGSVGAEVAWYMGKRLCLGLAGGRVGGGDVGVCEVQHVKQEAGEM